MPHPGRSMLPNEADRKLKSQQLQEMLLKYYIQGNLRPRLSSSVINSKRFRPALISPRQSNVKREFIWDTGIRPVFKSLTKNVGERGNK